MDTSSIRVIIFKEGGKWVAQCLEYDIGAQADELDDLKQRLVCAVEAELRASLKANGKPFDGIAAAPDYFRKMWDRRSVVVGFVGKTRLEADSKTVELDLAMAA